MFRFSPGVRPPVSLHYVSPVRFPSFSNSGFWTCCSEITTLSSCIKTQTAPKPSLPPAPQQPQAGSFWTGYAKGTAVAAAGIGGVALGTWETTSDALSLFATRLGDQMGAYPLEFTGTYLGMAALVLSLEVYRRHKAETSHEASLWKKTPDVGKSVMFTSAAFALGELASHLLQGEGVHSSQFADVYGDIVAVGLFIAFVQAVDCACEKIKGKYEQASLSFLLSSSLLAITWLPRFLCLFDDTALVVARLQREGVYATLSDSLRHFFSS
ncbi:MAG: hypothetical protein COX62_03350 [Deltaproteobacteria bacterium CG_4_10_14_0_2_um_filter_43_8]|nr:MAG: hypothetical protein COV43_08440 [Deltaproteobacteria bacterium CG11_big_fil_rev_8_21_14_0_20_42_23]PJA21088.1 MAG: hypothetical protein COX62_03350 [Deltaproteobacteria bacterium CG_4_10_14_0_2_um_filter_43_8]PJC63702.1 MAG: hypothetical protein CO021_08190 [Deltaproteobacteria bacterium CG_4_9_14_0_2_um_filter_42_21]